MQYGIHRISVEGPQAPPGAAPLLHPVPTGFFNLKSDEVLLYRVRDLQLTMSLGQRIFGVGTVSVVSSDKSIPHLDLKHVKRPREVKELIHKHVEEAKDKHRMRATELVGGGEDDGSYDPDDDLNE